MIESVALAEPVLYALDPDDFRQGPLGTRHVPQRQEEQAEVVEGTQLAIHLFVQLVGAPQVRCALVRLAAARQHVPQAVLRLGLYGVKASGRRVRQNCPPTTLGFGEVATVMNDVALADPAQEDRVPIPG